MLTYFHRSSACLRPFVRQFPRHFRRAGAPLSRRPFSTNSSINNTGMNFIRGLIGVNTAVFAAILLSPPQARNAAASPGLHTTSNPSLYWKLRENLPLSLNNIRKGKYWTTITAGFTHYGTMHFVGNMFSMYAFGSILCHATWTSRPISTPGVVILAFGSLLSGSIFFLYDQKKKERPFQSVEGIGASGMVMGLGAAAALLAPKERLLIYGVLPVPVWLLIGGYFVFDSVMLGSLTSGTGHAAHIGGLTFGALYYILSLRRFGGVLGSRIAKGASRPLWRGRR